jgi:Chitobiase/beta-hexosaminidase C-terminal domain
MAGTPWAEPFTTVDPSVWVAPFGVAPTAIGGGKIKLDSAVDTCVLIRKPFGAEGTANAKSLTMAFTVYPAESTATYRLAAGNYQGTWPYIEPHTNLGGFTFLDVPDQVIYPNGISAYSMLGDTVCPITPFEVRVSVNIDTTAGTIRNTMTIDGVVVLDDYSQDTSVTWDTVTGYSLPHFRGTVGGAHVVIGGVYGTYGGTALDNVAWVKGGTTPSTITPTATFVGAILTLDAPSNLPIVYSRTKSEVETVILAGGTVAALVPDLYTAPIVISPGETIWASVIAGNRTQVTAGPTYTLAYAATVPIEVSVPPPAAPTINAPVIIAVGPQLVVITTDAGVIHYTLDGSTPTASSPIYTAPIYLSTTTTIRAVTVGATTSAEAQVIITITNGDVSRITSYPDAIMPLVLEQYKADNP